MNKSSPRRWFRISLRSLFVLLTLACVWLGWELSIVRARKNVLRKLTTQRFSITTAAAWEQRIANGTKRGMQLPPPTTISPLRVIVGDEAIQSITFDGPNANEAELARLQKLFPEAKVTHRPPKFCHPGCFPAGTLVETPRGARRIESLAAGDEVTSLTADGAVTATTVRFVFIAENQLWRIETDAGSLLTTETQPLCLASGRIKVTGELQTGDDILSYRNGALRRERVRSVAPTERRERVYNVVLGNSELFVAGGYLARSKPPATNAEE